MSQLRELRVPELRLPSLQHDGPSARGLLPAGLPPGLAPVLGGPLAGPLAAGGLPGAAVAPGAGFLTLPSPGVPRRRHSWICR
ncbi:hypothetical protein ONE63_000355 [Megalurothrips usitatus]|uniref:Uncharacterized protein n=1 Tax=Megalurothrips usitatus TaxID=439358 RepID=A0AAV7XZ86_9NEOP|nr:hypothetical protein ONE63_000355 [Megalurothrips usitatus]